MEKFFSSSPAQNFEIFSTSHLMAVTFALLAAVFLFIVTKKFQDSPPLFQALRWGLFAVLITCELSYHIWAISVDIWSFRGYMPFHLSSIGALTAMIGLFTLNRTWVQISFFIGVVPAFLTLLTPDLRYDYDHLRFWIFFLQHIAILLASLFLALHRPHLITFRSVAVVYLLLLLYASFVGFIINPALDSNFMYLANRPGTDTLLDYFGEGFTYYLSLCLTALAVFLLQFFLWSKFVAKKE